MKPRGRRTSDIQRVHCRGKAKSNPHTLRMNSYSCMRHNLRSVELSCSKRKVPLHQCTSAQQIHALNLLHLPLFNIDRLELLSFCHQDAHDSKNRHKKNNQNFKKCIYHGMSIISIFHRYLSISRLLSFVLLSGVRRAYAVCGISPTNVTNAEPL